jgi:HK97 family phage major capsid protein
MDPELKRLADEIKANLASFKEANDRELAEIKAKGQASAETVAKVTAIDAKLTELQAEHQKVTARATELETLMARVGTQSPAVNSEAEAREELGIRSFLARTRGTPVDAVTVTAEDRTKVRTYKTAFLALARRGGQNGNTLSPEIHAALSVGSDPDGGYLVPPDMSGRVVQLVYETSPMRQLASVQEVRGNELNGTLDLDEADSGWVSETAARPETATPEIGAWKIPVHEQYAAPRATQTAIDDIPDIEAWLNRKVSDKLSRRENTGFVTGNGVGKPRGFLTYADGVPAGTSIAAWQVIERSKTGVNGAFHATLPGDVFHTTIGKLKAAYLRNAQWVMPRATLAAVRKIKDGDGTYLWEKSFAAAQPFQLLGYPVTLFEDMTAIATGALGIGFGDFREGYQIADRLGIRLLRDPYTAKPFVVFYTTKRVGGDVVNFEAIKLIEFSA